MEHNFLTQLPNDRSEARCTNCGLRRVPTGKKQPFYYKGNKRTSLDEPCKSTGLELQDVVSININNKLLMEAVTVVKVTATNPEAGQKMAINFIQGYNF